MDLNGLILILPAMLKGAGVTLLLTVVSVFFGIILGLLLALARLSKNFALNKFSQFYIWFFRGTPLLLQLFFIFYELPMLIHVPMGQYFASFVALSLNSGAYLAEIIRAAIQSIDKGQMEASRALGMTYGQAMRRIIVPQSYRRLIPPVGNEFIALLKDTSLVCNIGMTELMFVTSSRANSSGQAIYYLPAAILYLAMTSVFTYVFSRLEKKYSAYE
ncbi:MAG: amino acid ABC transporter permease [Clostridia bacterium]|nr:amino acid ABC transporter permease [Clostridia bacterium]MDR3645820.1 amino acid ABC transporter permease [Clostridia bacterium]